MFRGIRLRAKKIPSFKYLNFCDLNYYYEKGMEVSELATWILKKPSLLNCQDLARIENEVSSWSPVGVVWLNVEAIAFSDEEIKYAIHEAYRCCFVAHNLLDSLNSPSNHN